MKIELAQISTDPGNLDKNFMKVVRAIETAKKEKSDIVVFPELAIPGYMSMDLFLNRNYLKANKYFVQSLSGFTENIMAIVGFVDYDKKGCYNCAAIFQDGKLIGVQNKTLLPEYDVFFENRYFTSSKEEKIFEYKGVKIGIEICEDLWDEMYPVKVSDRLVDLGAEVLINISASPFYAGKLSERQRLIEKVVKKHKVPFVYTNLVGGQDGYEGELVFDGQSLVYNSSSQLIGLGKRFEEDVFSVDLDSGNSISPPKFNPNAETYEALVLGIREYFRRTGFKKGFIGLSGGIDSALTACLATEALGKENVFGISMPSKYSSPGSIEDAKILAGNLGIDFKILSIEKIHEVLEGQFRSEFQNINETTVDENLQARLRGLILMAHANKYGGLVITTANKTETALGYTTLYGDMCGAIAPISDVSKLKVYELAKYINKISKRYIIPARTISKAPSAELKDNQTDEGSLGAPYLLISPLVDEIIEDGANIAELTGKYPEDLVRRITRIINYSEYKRRQAPPGIKVTKKAFGTGRRVPIAHNFKD